MSTPVSSRSARLCVFWSLACVGAAPALAGSGLEVGVTLGSVRVSACAGDAAAAVEIGPTRGSTSTRVSGPGGSASAQGGAADDGGGGSAGGHHDSSSTLTGVSASASAGGAGTVAGAALARGGATRAGTGLFAEARQAADFTLPPHGCLVATVDYRLDYSVASDVARGSVHLSASLDAGDSSAEKSFGKALAGADSLERGGTLTLTVRNPGAQPLPGRLLTRTQIDASLVATAD
ncbi:hypothetical protein [Derxia lacustris]|uniref:hypothetical protein n=1 Tax=Derxia lacustris TaxID=764842 RepID=UPI00111C57D5|nr:hypothetical protein [Derxia lacustris]